MTLIRRVAAVAVAVAAVSLPLVPAQATAACDPTQTFCVDYTATVVSAETGLPTTQSLEPAGLKLQFANTSANYRDEASQPRWLNTLSATLVSSGTIRPAVTPSAQLPDGLLLAGSPDSQLCASGTDRTFAACTAGRGVAYAKITSSGLPSLVLPSGIYTATYGVKQVKNVSATTDLAKYRITLGICLQKGTDKCVSGEQSHVQDIVVPHPPAGQPLQLNFTMPTGISPVSGVVVDRFTVHTLGLDLNGVANKLADGTTVASRTVIALPKVCGPVSAGATLTSVSGKAVTLNQGMTITGCTVLTAAFADSTLTYGATAALTGTLKTDAGAAVPGRSIKIVRCAVGQHACVTANVTTNSAGGFSYAWIPVANTTVTVSDTISNRWVTRTVRVATRVSLALSASTMHSGGYLRFGGSVAPNHAGGTVKIQRRVGTTWTTIATAKLTSTSAYTRTLKLTGAKGGKAAFRVVMPAHADNTIGVSPTRYVTFK